MHGPVCCVHVHCIYLKSSSVVPTLFSASATRGATAASGTGLTCGGGDQTHGQEESAGEGTLQLSGQCVDNEQWFWSLLPLLDFSILETMAINSINFSVSSSLPLSLPLSLPPFLLLFIPPSLCLSL